MIRSILLAALPLWSQFYFDASFIYWQAEEQGLNLAQSAVLNQGNVILAPNSISIHQPTEYHPGFKVGCGAILSDSWKIRSEYTWFRGQTTIDQTAPSADIQGFGIWNIADWFQQTISFQQFNSTQGQSLSGTSLSSVWDLGLDRIDLDAGRLCYAASSLAFFPFIGLQSIWIRQSMEVALMQAAASEGGSQYLGPQPIYSHNRSSSWAIGPRMGLEGNCLFAPSWQIKAKCAISTLATYFGDVTHSEDAQSIAVYPGPYKQTLAAFVEILPVAEMGLGLNWTISSFQLDASYDCSIFWNQNVIRKMLDQFWSGTDASCGNLTFHGLTLSGRYDF